MNPRRGVLDNGKKGDHSIPKQKRNHQGKKQRNRACTSKIKAMKLLVQTNCKKQIKTKIKINKHEIYPVFGWRDPLPAPPWGDHAWQPDINEIKKGLPP